MTALYWLFVCVQTMTYAKERRANQELHVAHYRTAFNAARAQNHTRETPANAVSYYPTYRIGHQTPFVSSNWCQCEGKWMTTLWFYKCVVCRGIIHSSIYCLHWLCVSCPYTTSAQSVIHTLFIYLFIYLDMCELCVYHLCAVRPAYLY